MLQRKRRHEEHRLRHRRSLAVPSRYSRSSQPRSNTASTTVATPAVTTAAATSHSMRRSWMSRRRARGGFAGLAAASRCHRRRRARVGAPTCSTGHHRAAEVHLSVVSGGEATGWGMASADASKPSVRGAHSEEDSAPARFEGLGPSQIARRVLAPAREARAWARRAVRCRQASVTANEVQASVVMACSCTYGSRAMSCIDSNRRPRRGSMSWIRSPRRLHNTRKCSALSGSWVTAMHGRQPVALSGAKSVGTRICPA